MITLKWIMKKYNGETRVYWMIILKCIMKKYDGETREYWMTILKWIMKKYDGRAWTILILLRKGKGVSCFERGNEHPGSIKCGERLDKLINY